MAQWQSAGIPHLVVLAPASHSGRRIELSGDYMVVGREPTCQIQLEDPHVSRTHAALERHGNAVYVQDLGSSGGTFVNGAPPTARELRSGDVIRFASVQARFEAGPPVADATRAMPAQAGAAPAQPGGAPAYDGSAPAPAAAVDYSIGHQHAGAINNVGRDQYHAHIQHVVHQRDGFLREVAATKTKARWLVRLGFLLFVVGFGVFAAIDLNFIKQIANDVSTGNTAPPTNPFGRPVAGIPLGLLGWAMAAIGMLMFAVGIVLHIVATSRRRRVEREFPMPLPWQTPGS